MAKKIHTYYYNENYNPAMPVVKVGLSVPGRSQAQTFVTALVDCGSDGTLIPLHILESMGAKLVDKAYIRGVLGHRQAVKLYMIDLYLAGHKIYAVEVVAVGPDDEIILGRDVLNQLEITLNGPAGVIEIPE